VARMGEKRNVYMLLVGKSEGERPLGRPRCRCIDNIKFDLLEIRLSVVDWIGLSSGCTTCGLPCGTQLHRVSWLVSELDWNRLFISVEWNRVSSTEATYWPIIRALDDRL
jgi:hypothetical protein